jgi:5'-methylthioadenosine phosphorylase
MSHIGFIVGSGFSFPDGAAVKARTLSTPHGSVEIAEWEESGHRVTFLPRHGPGHARLSHQVAHRANLAALHNQGVSAIVASTAVGVLEPAVPLGIALLFDDLYFPSNRLPDGTLATFFGDEDNALGGHWIPAAPFSPTLRTLLAQAADRAGLAIVDGGCYVHADGPRFNTRAEHAAFRAAGGTAVSQTCGPEAVLAGEIGIPYALVGFGVNYVADVEAAGVAEADLDALLAQHGGVVSTLFREFLALLPAETQFACDTGTVYRVPR